MDGRPRPGADVKLWNGVSRGRWEGNTLVIDTTNLNGYTWIDDSGNFYTDAARLVERLTMFAPDTIHYAVTLEDAKAYTRPWTAVWAQVRVTEKGFELFEESCWEGERDLPRFRELGYRDYYGEPWSAGSRGDGGGGSDRRGPCAIAQGPSERWKPTEQGWPNAA